MLLLEFAFVIYVTVTEAKERSAGLLVLPPLVIGYDELNPEESVEEFKNDDLQKEFRVDGQEFGEIRRRFNDMDTMSEYQIGKK